MSFLRRVLARAQGAQGLQPPRVHAFARALESDATPEGEVGRVPQSSPTPATTPTPLVTPEAAVVRDAVSGQGPTPSVQASPLATPSTLRTHTVERIERSVPQSARASTTVVHVHRPVVERTHERTVEVERHHIHDSEPRHQEQHTERVEHHERVVVQTTTPRAAPSERARAVPTVSGSVTQSASPVAAPRTVHVNIGRIVVSAASPAAKTQAPAPVPAKPSAKSLAEILAAKKGRS